MQDGARAAAPAPGASERLVGDFLAYLELERGLSRNTLDAYRSDLQQLCAYLDRQGLTVEEATHGDLAAFLDELAEGGAGRPPVAATTLGRKVACLRSFYRHLRREELIEHDPTADLHGPRKPKRLPQVLTREEVRRLLEQPRGSSPLAQRDRALLEVMYACGLRASEAVSLELGDLDLEEGLLRTRGKGSKERIVPVGRQALAALSVYLRSGRPDLVGNRPQSRLLVNHRGGALTRQGLYKIVQGHARAAGLAERMSPHTLAPQLRHAPARGRLRPALAAGDARPRRSRHDAGLHPPLRRAAQGCVFRSASAGHRPPSRRGGVRAGDHRPSVAAGRNRRPVEDRR